MERKMERKPGRKVERNPLHPLSCASCGKLGALTESECCPDPSAEVSNLEV